MKKKLIALHEIAAAEYGECKMYVVEHLPASRYVDLHFTHEELYEAKKILKRNKRLFEFIRMTLLEIIILEYK